MRLDQRRAKTHRAPVAARRVLVGLVLVVMVLLAGGVASAQAATLFVDQGNPSCSNTGPGSETVPYCTISAAAAQTTAGTTVRVSSGTYSEQVSVKSGAAGSPVVFEPAPGASVTVTGGTYGFYASNKKWVTIRGFNVTGTTSDGIHVSSSASDVEVIDNHVTYAGQPVSGLTAKGISVTNATNCVVRGNTVDHNSNFGIYLSDSTGIQVKGNTAFANAKVFQRSASGIRLYRSSGNTVAANVTRDNEDSGIELYTISNNNVVVNNVSYGNGDHGIDNFGSTGSRVVSNSVYDNVTAGINLEGGSTGGTLANNISVDNGIDSPRTKGNLRVDAQSTSGTTIDYDVVHIPAPHVQIDWAGTHYASLGAFAAATGQEAHGIQADPDWADPSGGDLRLTAGSPAIDAADSGAAGWSATDLDGNGRVDDPGTPNTGAGSVAYADRGAFELQPPPNTPPSAALTVTPSSGVIDLDVTADASGSTDTDWTPIATYSFDFGDGSPEVGPQAGATAPHTYDTPGTYTVTVTVTDTVGLSSTATQTVTVTDAPPSASLTVSPASGLPPLQVTADASGSTDADATPIASYRFDWGDGSPVVGPQPEATATHTYAAAGTYTVTVTVTDTAGLSSTATAEVQTFDNDAPPSAALTVTPSSGTIDLDVTADASASTDVDKTPIGSYSFDFGDGSPVVGPQAGATATHTYEAPGTYTVTVTVTDTAGLSSTATQTVTVTDAPPSASLTVTPASGLPPMEVAADASGSTDADATPIASYSFDWGDGSPVAGPQAGATATHTYTSTGTFTVTVTVTDTAGLSSTATAQVVVTNLVGNAGFESDTAGWNVSGSGPNIALTRVAGGHSGGWAAKLTNTGTTNSSCTLNDSPNWVSTTSAGTYTGVMWVRADTAGAALKLRFREWSGSTLVGTATTQVTLTTSWQKVTVTHATATPGASNLDLNAYVVGAPPGTCFYADDAAIGLS